MGGLGSGQRWGELVRGTVESCLTLDMNRLRQSKLVFRGPRQALITWTWAGTGEKVGSVACWTEPAGGRVTHLVLKYTATIDGQRHEIVERIRLQTTPMPNGGVRWWFTCPLACDGVFCGRRVGTLHLPPGARYFACRHCHMLTYTSCQESHKYDGVFRELGVPTGLTPREATRWALGEF